MDSKKRMNMAKKRAASSNGATLAAATRDQEKARYVLRLYVSGMTPQSSRAIANIKRICDAHLRARYELEVIDIYQQPGLAQGEQILAVPTLIKKLPLPLRRLVGDLSSVDRVLFGLDLRSP
jgi:circadian clock protein KaiB